MKPPQLAGCHRSGSRSPACLPGLLKGAEAPEPGGCAGGAGRSPPLHREAEVRGVPSPALANLPGPAPEAGRRPRVQGSLLAGDFPTQRSRGAGFPDRRSGGRGAQGVHPVPGTPALLPPAPERRAPPPRAFPAARPELSRGVFRGARCVWAAPGVSWVAGGGRTPRAPVFSLRSLARSARGEETRGGYGARGWDPDSPSR